MLQSIRDPFSLVGRTKMRAETASSRTFTLSKAMFFGGNDHVQGRNLEGGSQAKPEITSE